ncbi:ATP-dependent Clp protease ATP-binding subunit [Texcoconibacillus texcoconensis]|uniref:ATP-dependent Clp protease ATP-binding subunit ClpE n=1 Tax=Texcoconibacillus texcoconensis TaxID=1095777 RepID=A0A840QP53_9BACI|nr:ATP-dependent Clp protease ATP-binding subunit ClpE [Texcoconibacillus texcoconensis]
MNCQKCQNKQAVVEMNIQVNEQRQRIRLCESCYQELKNGMSVGNMQSFGNGSPFNKFLGGMMHSDMGSEQEQSNHAKDQDHGLLDELAQNISHSAKAGLIDPVIGRDEEIQQVIEALNRRNKSNPMLIGEPGVGKTAIAEGLALKIAENGVPKKLRNKQVYMLDVTSLVANTGVRGQFEERMKQLIAELKERQNVILFIDEIHMIVGAGSAEGSMDAGNILKPALARGEFQMIGATTLSEYRQIEKDAAFERRLQPIIVKEPTVDEAIEILRGIQDKYETYHEVTFTDEAIRACVTLADRYIQDRQLPDKAIDLLDESGSKMNLAYSDGQTSTDPKARLNEIYVEKEQAIKEEKYERAAELQKEEKELLDKLDHAEESTNEKVVIQVDDIQNIIEQKTGIPVSKLQEDEQSKLKSLEKRLAEKVIGQEEAVQKVAKAIRRSRVGLKAKHRPIGSFLFVGPTGVGKTELTKQLAEELFGQKDAMIRLDMSEYMEKHAVSKLIGSPPGYVGHEEAGQLTERVRRNPYSIILLDEIEKAHPDVHHMFLQILEDGQLTDSQGRTVSFKDTAIIMTSNAGVNEKKVTVGFGENDKHEEVNILDSLGAYFKPEFLNRFDNIVRFNHLNEDHLIAIVDTMLSDLEETLQEQDLTITVSSEAKQRLADLGYHPAFGARPLRRVIQEQIEDPIADQLIDNEDRKSLHVDVIDEKIIVEAQSK